MKRVKYLIRSNTDATTSPLLVVRVGISRREQLADAELCARALLDNSIYYCVKCHDSQLFVLKLLEQNWQREIYHVSPVDALYYLKNRAMASHVENLSARYQVNDFRTRSKTHQNPTP